MNLRLDASDTHGNSSSSSLAHPTFSTFFFNATPTTEIYTLSLHDALPISDDGHFIVGAHAPLHLRRGVIHTRVLEPVQVVRRQRSEEHTSELQSRRDLVCRLLLEKKKEPMSCSWSVSSLSSVSFCATVHESSTRCL